MIKPRNLILSILVLGTALVVVPAAWSWPEGGAPVASSAGNQTLVALVPDGHGGSFVAWSTYTLHSDSNAVVFAQHLSGGGAPTWGKDGVIVATPGDVQLAAAMISDDKGGVIVAVTQGKRLEPKELILQRLSNSGRPLWGDAGVDIGAGQSPALAGDGTGGAIVVFESGPHVQAEHLGSTGSVLWATPVAPSDGANQGVPVLAAGDGSGGAFVAWGYFPPLFAGAAQHLGADGSRLWSDSGITLSSRPQDMVADAGGGIIVGGFRPAPSGGNEVFLQKFDADGHELWTPGGVRAAGADADVGSLDLVSDGAGGAALTWDQTSGVFAQRVDSSGSPLWTADGVLVSAPDDRPRLPEIALDAEGGAFISYPSLVDNGTLDLLLQHLSADGQPTAPRDTVAHVVGDYTTFLTADDRGNDFLAWSAYKRAFYIEPVRGFVAKLPLERSHRQASAALARAIQAPSIEPNPSRGSFTASGVLPDDRSAIAQLFDLRGRLVAARALMPTGGVWRAGFGLSQHLASGSYMLRVVQGTAVSTQKVVVVR